MPLSMLPPYMPSLRLRFPKVAAASGVYQRATRLGKTVGLPFFVGTLPQHNLTEDKAVNNNDGYRLYGRSSDDLGAVGNS